MTSGEDEKSLFGGWRRRKKAKPNTEGDGAAHSLGAFRTAIATEFALIRLVSIARI